MKLPKSLTEVRLGLQKKDFSAVSLVDAYLKRIKDLNPKLNAFLTVTEDEAYRKAKEVDKIISVKKADAFKGHPLLGSIVSYKDLYLTEGVRTTAGSKLLEDYTPQYSGTIVKKLDAACSIMIGKTNCDAWAHGASGENSDYGATLNPWNREFVPGGSSSGSAVSVASALSNFSFGTDTGGSVRLPASFCGVVGLKPTYGSISRYGVIAMASSLDTMGFFAQNSSDAEAIFNIVKGEDGFDSTVKNSTTLKPKNQLTIGIPKEYFLSGIDGEIQKSVENAISVFKGMGIKVKEVSLPHTKYAVPVYYIVMSAEVSSNLGRYDGIRYGKGREVFGDEAVRRIMLGSFVLSAGYFDAYYLKAQKVRTKIINDFDRVFEEVDAIISPVSPTPPFKLGEKTQDPLSMYLADIFTAGANLAGIPGLAIPNGFTKKGLPLGFQLLGPRFSENTLFDLGKKFEKETSFEFKIAGI